MFSHHLLWWGASRIEDLRACFERILAAQLVDADNWRSKVSCFCICFFDFVLSASVLEFLLLFICCTSFPLLLLLFGCFITINRLLILSFELED